MKRLLLALLLLSAPAYAQTAHFNASDTSNVFTTAGNPPSGVPVNGNTVAEQKAESGDIACDAGDGPVWRSPSNLLLPALDYDGTNDHCFLENDAGTDYTLDTFVNADAFTVMMAIYVEACPSTAANPYDNAALITDSGQFWGIFCKDVAGTPNLLLYNWDGNADVVSLPIALNTRYIVTYRHSGGNISGSLNCGSETSAASDNTTGLAGIPTVGTANGFVALYSGLIGEMKIWDTGNAGGSQAAECAAMHSAWVTAAVSIPVHQHHYQQMRRH